MQTYLDRLAPGRRFRLAGDQITGTLIECNECSARVRIDRGPREVTIENDDGTKRTFTANRVHETTWAPATVVVPIYTPAEEERKPMSKKSSKPAASKKASAPKTTKPKAEKKAPAPAKTKVAKPKTYEVSEQLDAVIANAEAKPAKEPKAPKEKKVSAVDAAARLLAEVGTPLGCKDMIEQIAAKGYWTSPGGATPHATLYSAIIREIKEKGDAARFEKTDRGMFKAKA